MSGITGIFNFNNPINPTELDRFTDALSHRGPDGRGTFIDGNFGLGHRRLAILGLSDAGKCPMPYGGEDGKRYWITLNGEIYNFLELRGELEKLGHRFRTDTDTEVVIAAYVQWGDNCLLHFNGMWALAIWDSLEKNLFLARDRFAIKPLYYWGANRFAFASELKAFLALDDFSPALNEQIIPRIIENAYSCEGTTDETILRDVRCLSGGFCLTINSQGVGTMKKWWDTSKHIPQIPAKYEEQVEQFRELFLDAVRIRMRSDIPTGICLNGGIGSSAVACSAAWHHHEKKAGLERCTEDWQHTFIPTVHGAKSNWQKYADEIVQYIDAKPHYWVFDGHNALKHVMESIWATEDIYGGMNVPIWSAYREMRQDNVVVSLEGHGADELLCGHPRHLDWPTNQVNQNLYNDFHLNFMPSALRNYDRCSMAHGIEVRMPFMDWRLVSFAFGLPVSSKIGEGYTKRILRDAMAGIMPAKVRKRHSDIGFNMPITDLSKGGILHLMRGIMNR